LSQHHLTAQKALDILAECICGRVALGSAILQGFERYGV